MVFGKILRKVRKFGVKAAHNVKIGGRKMVNTSHMITKQASKVGKIVSAVGAATGNSNLSNIGQSISSTSDRVRNVTNSASRAGDSIEKAVRSGRGSDVANAFEDAKGLAKHFE